VDALRLQRYRKKQTYIVDSLVFIQPLGSDELRNRGVLYSIQTVIEGVIDIVAMLVKDLGMLVEEDSKNIQKLVDYKNLDQKVGEDLVRANGFRNLVVHRYNGISEDKVSNAIEEIQQIIPKWLKIVEEVLHEITHNQEP
jgi:uncharacterized protein YutE (UPF0331/DUF86 family)